MAPKTNYFELRICVVIHNTSGITPYHITNSISGNIDKLEIGKFEHVGKDARRNTIEDPFNDCLKSLNLGSISSKNMNWEFCNFN